MSCSMIRIKRKGAKTIKRVGIILSIVLLMAIAFPVTAAALTISGVEDVYTAGEVIVVNISDNEAVDPADYSINITKPNGDDVIIAPRQTRKNAENECFETYTIEMLGDYIVTVTAADGDSAQTTFSAKVFTRNSIIFLIVSVIVFLTTLSIALKQMRTEKKRAKE